MIHPVIDCQIKHFFSSKIGQVPCPGVGQAFPGADIAAARRA